MRKPGYPIKWWNLSIHLNHNFYNFRKIMEIASTVFFWLKFSMAAITIARKMENKNWTLIFLRVPETRVLNFGKVSEHETLFSIRSLLPCIVTSINLWGDWMLSVGIVWAMVEGAKAWDDVEHLRTTLSSHRCAGLERENERRWERERESQRLGNATAVTVQQGEGTLTP